ncbi:electron transfer flavoprotein beta subunit/FixA family protein [Arcanobacterium haemolyticum]|uniref:Electron transfer flavoprotein small subunit n=1 Tax=Arcanobacterium haemolyticum (strain ATCC 9345 / DSM 20595 / CCM 5947 / CCUG 17215 / LMG 16163 / NBRC 15585 / NCTC 8452 / 11018) TaxID=644284 RepID=D7BK78_ARCHD|nr:electron transfer flavoprotein subunit alpha [Arcanobacterium haemolyticum]ADH93058.1 Electron transfer flavoprotein alpha/beta-subunit [Arcanobacterium haemolyticum DSM 20595]QCX47123.1 electron transfer flavoprotein beta subunit/FixA family protein [Arcanobacterium haemolyticum]SQH28184.1 Electron transfer flavoprotein small subunit [Arcanobacterium haemolyticum]
MSIVVAYKYAANPQDASVASNGAVDWTRAKSSVAEYDSVALTLAREIADKVGTDVVGISVGKSDVASSLAKKNALSKGLDSALVVADDETATWSATGIASALAELVKRVEGADLVLTGDSSIDEGARLMSGLIAGFLNWPAFQNVVSVDKTPEGYSLVQQDGQGLRTILITGPVVVAAASDAVVAKVPSMKDILAAGKKNLETVAIADMEIVRPDIRIASTNKPQMRARKNITFAGESAVTELVAALKNDGVL